MLQAIFGCVGYLMNCKNSHQDASVTFVFALMFGIEFGGFGYCRNNRKHMTTTTTTASIAIATVLLPLRLLLLLHCLRN